MPRKVQGSFDLAQIAGEELAGAAVPVTMAEPPTGAATAARQDTGNGILTTMDASLASVDGKLTSGVVTNAAAASSGGASSFVRIAQGASEDKTVVKASPGTLYTLNASMPRGPGTGLVEFARRISSRRSGGSGGHVRGPGSPDNITGGDGG